MTATGDVDFAASGGCALETPARIRRKMISHPIRVFLVEDSAILRERLLEMLAAGGLAEIVGHAETEAEAETALQTQEWDVLILDLQLLQGSGMGVLRSLASHRKPGTIAIVLTNYAIPLYRTRSMQLGADYFFDKAHEFAHVRKVLTELAVERTATCRLR
jgi:DNA-binding NarL/FixJ family response regulator